MSVDNTCKKMAALIKKGKHKHVGDFIDPIFIEGLKHHGIFLETIPTEFSCHRIKKIIIKEKELEKKSKVECNGNIQYKKIQRG